MRQIYGLHPCDCALYTKERHQELTTPGASLCAELMNHILACEDPYHDGEAPAVELLCPHLTVVYPEAHRVIEAASQGRVPNHPKLSPSAHPGRTCLGLPPWPGGYWQPRQPASCAALLGRWTTGPPTIISWRDAGVVL